MDFGSTLRAAREAKNLTISQVAAKTHILAQTIEGLERNDFKMIPAPIYGRGFVKLIAECLDADAAMLMELFKDAYSNRSSGPAQAAKSVSPARAVSPVPPERTEAVPAPTPTPQSSRHVETDLFQDVAEEKPRTLPASPAVQDEPPPQPVRRNPPEPQPAVSARGGAEDLFNRVEEPQSYSKSPSRFAAPLPDDSDDSDSQGVFTYVAEGFSYGVEHAKRRIKRVPSSFWRMAVLVVCSIVIVYLIIAGLLKIFGISQNRIPEVNGSFDNASNLVEQSSVPTLEDAVNGKVAPETKTTRPPQTDKSEGAVLPEPIYYN